MLRVMARQGARIRRKLRPDAIPAIPENLPGADSSLLVALAGDPGDSMRVLSIVLCITSG